MHKSIGTSRDHAIIRAESWYKPCSYELVNPAIKISLLYGSSDWDLALKCVCGPNFTSFLIGESPISAQEWDNRTLVGNMGRETNDSIAKAVSQELRYHWHKYISIS